MPGEVGAVRASAMKDANHGPLDVGRGQVSGNVCREVTELEMR